MPERPRPIRELKEVKAADIGSITPEEFEILFDHVASEAKFEKARWKALEATAREDWTRLERAVIAKVKELPENCRQSGDDSNYLDLWEEYCAQVQGEHSVMFGLYESTVEGFCEAALDALTPSARMSLWVTSEAFGELDFEDDGESMFHPLVNRMVDELHERVRANAANVELETLDERLLAIAPWWDTCIALVADPGTFMENMFADASEYVLAAPSSFRELALSIAPDALEDMKIDGAPTYEFGRNLAEQQAYVAEKLEQFLHAWRAAAKEKFGARLGL